MSTYLVAFIVSDYEFKEKVDANGLRHRVYVRPNDIYALDFALEKSNKILVALSNYLGVNYTLPKIDHVAVPNLPNFGINHYLPFTKCTPTYTRIFHGFFLNI